MLPATSRSVVQVMPDRLVERDVDVLLRGADRLGRRRRRHRLCFDLRAQRRDRAVDGHAARFDPARRPPAASTRRFR